MLSPLFRPMSMTLHRTLHRGLVRRVARCLVMAGLACGVIALQAAGPLNLFIWSEYIDPAVVSEFERRFDCKVVVDLYEDDAAMLAKLRAGGAGYDVAVPTDHRIPTLVKLGLLAPLRPGNLPNLRHVDPRFVDPPYDRGNRFSVAYQWGTLGVLVRRESGQPMPDSWAAVLGADDAWRPRVLIDNPRDLIGAALKYKGWSLNSTNPVELRGARDVLIAAKDRCLGFDGSVGGRNKVLARQARSAVVYSGEAARAMAEDPELGYMVPREGSQIWVDNLVVLAQAPHRDLAEQFLNFVLEPDIAARIANYTHFATANQAARAKVNPADLANPVIYAPDDVVRRLEYLRDPGPEEARMYDAVWTQVKNR